MYFAYIKTNINDQYFEHSRWRDNKFTIGNTIYELRLSLLLSPFLSSVRCGALQARARSAGQIASHDARARTGGRQQSECVTSAQVSSWKATRYTAIADANTITRQQ